MRRSRTDGVRAQGSCYVTRLSSRSFDCLGWGRSPGGPAGFGTDQVNEGTALLFMVPRVSELSVAAEAVPEE